MRKVISECENDGEVNCSETASSNLSPISIKEYDVSYAKISVNPLNGNDSNKESTRCYMEFCKRYIALQCTRADRICKIITYD